MSEDIQSSGMSAVAEVDQYKDILDQTDNATLTGREEDLIKLDPSAGEDLVFVHDDSMKEKGESIAEELNMEAAAYSDDGMVVGDINDGGIAMEKKTSAVERWGIIDSDSYPKEEIRSTATEETDAVSMKDIKIKESTVNFSEKSPEQIVAEVEGKTQADKELIDADVHKLETIRTCCLYNDRPGLSDLAVANKGLLNDEARQYAWPILLGQNEDMMMDKKGSRRVDWRQLPRHRDEEQVSLDVNRSFVYYPTNISPTELEDRRTQLSNLIIEVLRRHPMLCYFQGYHDICQVIVLVLGPEIAPLAMEYISLLRIRDFMLPSLSPALSHLYLIHPILSAVDLRISKHVSAIQPYFALTATLTLYAHEIQVYSDVARLFDVFLAEGPAFPVYFFAVIVISRRDELLDIPEDEPDMLHAILSRLPKPLNLEGLITQARALRNQHPPNTFPIWRSISSNSVLKTYVNPVSSKRQEDLPTSSEALARGEMYFSKQCSELAREQLKLKIYNGLVKNKSMLGWTIVVGASAVVMGLYFGKRGVDTKSAWDAVARSPFFG